MTKDFHGGTMDDEKEKKCVICEQVLKNETELKNELCWVCIRLRNSAMTEKHFHQVEA